jgi:hypothetical protein
MNFEDVTQILKRVLRRPVAYHRAFAELAGKASAGVMLSQAWYWTQRADDDNGWFYKTREQWLEETALTRTEQETARARLVKKGLLEEKLAGMPGRMYFRVNVEKVLRLLAENLPTVKASPVCGKSANTEAETPPTLYIDPESTREYTHKSECVALPAGSEQTPEASGGNLIHLDTTRLPEDRPISSLSAAEIAAVTRPLEFSAADSDRKARAARPPSKGKRPQPVAVALLPVPPKFYDTQLDGQDKREIAQDLEFDRGELPQRVEAWELSRRESNTQFVSVDAMKANLRKYLINCSLNKKRRAG